MSTQTSTTAARTVAVYTDPRASVLFLEKTVRTLVSRYSVEHAYVDLSTLPGLTVAKALRDADVVYESLDFGQRQPESGEASGIRNCSARTHTLDVGALGRIDANIVVVPAMPDDKLMDFSQGTVIGQVLNQAEDAGRDLLLVMPPERGLRPVRDTVQGAPYPREAAPDFYERIVVLVRNETTASAA